MAQSEPTLPTLRTLSMLPLRDADMLLGIAERLYGTQTTIEARQALRRIDTYRRLLGLPLSIRAMERMAIKSTRRAEALQRIGVEPAGTERHSVVQRYAPEIWRLAS
jgi:hypothetical protein